MAIGVQHGLEGGSECGLLALTWDAKSYNPGSLKGSVASLELRRSLAIASAKLDRHRAEQIENEAME